MKQRVTLYSKKYHPKRSKGPKKTLDRNATEENKKIFLEALNDNLGLVFRASVASGIHSIAHYTWMKTDPKYKEAVEDLIELKRDFVEKQLIGLVESKEPSCVTFTAKCLLRSRGYDQSIVLANQEGEKFQVQVSADIVNSVLKTMYEKADDGPDSKPNS